MSIVKSGSSVGLAEKMFGDQESSTSIVKLGDDISRGRTNSMASAGGSMRNKIAARMQDRLRRQSTTRQNNKPTLKAAGTLESIENSTISEG